MGRPSSLTVEALKAAYAGNFQEAGRILRQMESGASARVDIDHASGVLALIQGDIPRALVLLRSALNIDPQRTELHYELGRALGRTNDFAHAVAAHTEALRLAPRMVAAWLALGTAHEGLGNPSAALEAYEAALSIQPNLPEAHFNRGNALCQLSRHGDAIEAYQRALHHRPGFPDARYALGKALADCGQYDPARAALHEVMRLEPGWAAPHEACAHVDLAQARWRDGWLHYAWRSARLGSDARGVSPDTVVNSVPSISQLKGRRVVILAEQGLGDSLFFLRYARSLRTFASHCAYWGDERLFDLLRPLGLFDAYHSTSEKPNAEYFIRAGDLPLAMQRNSPEELAPLPALDLTPALDPEITHAMDQMLSGFGPGPYLALTWRAGTASRAGALSKNLALPVLVERVRNWPGTILSIQRQPGQAEIEQLERALGKSVADLSELNNDLFKMLHALNRIESYVGVSNTNMHLRAGLGKPATVFVPFPPEWRWGIAGATSTWYPQFEVIRQDESGNWLTR